MTKRKRIDSLSDAERAQMDAHADKWIEIGLRTGKADRARWEWAIERAYEFAGLPWHGNIVWVDSPLAMAIKGPTMAAELSGADVGKTIREDWHRYIGGQFWVGGWWGPAYASFFRDVCNLEDPKGDTWARLEVNEALCSSAGHYWPHSDFVVVSERPTVIHTELADPNVTRGWGSHRLHCEDGPAIAWPDGLGVWSWHGVRVPQRVIEQPETLTVDEALAEENAEIRRVMIERIGPERMMSAMKVLDSVDDDQVEIGTGKDGLPVPMGLMGGRLLEIPAHGEFPAMRWVALKNSTPEPDGSIKDYFLRVPPTARTVREAVAWTFGVEAGEYRPEIET